MMWSSTLSSLLILFLGLFKAAYIFILLSTLPIEGFSSIAKSIFRSIGFTEKVLQLQYKFLKCWKLGEKIEIQHLHFYVKKNYIYGTDLVQYISLFVASLLDQSALRHRRLTSRLGHVLQKKFKKYINFDKLYCY